ncbi:phosphatidylglycerol phospholipase [Martiniozyma asiatica (nom. inval.)]|nr:phosphatidylglycerol phospholipase [Martiniozyma asiatica]
MNKQIKLAGHRGFKAGYPENTIAAFQAAIDAGCSVIETDIHITSDDKVIIAHDINTARVFGADYNITKTPWNNVLSKLLTLEEPRSPIPLFDQLLDWCMNVCDGGTPIKIMLDIKTDNDPKKLYDLIWISFNNRRGVEYWNDKIIWGLWKPHYYLPEYLLGQEVININFDLKSAKEFNESIKIKNGKLSGISIIGISLSVDNDKKDLIAWCEKENIKLWFWTINKNWELNYAIEECKLKNSTILEGFVTDDPISLCKYTPITTKDIINWWFKKHIYKAFLFFFRRGYHLKFIFTILHKVGFI